MCLIIPLVCEVQNLWMEETEHTKHKRTQFTIFNQIKIIQILYVVHNNPILQWRYARVQFDLVLFSRYSY